VVQDCGTVCVYNSAYSGEVFLERWSRKLRVVGANHPLTKYGKIPVVTSSWYPFQVAIQLQLIIIRL